jgi:hypothetical protein
MLIGLAVALSASWAAFRTAPDRLWAITALLIAGLELTALAVLAIVNLTVFA